MPDAHTFTLFANHCRTLAVGAPTLAARYKYLDMALGYECEAEASRQHEIAPEAKNPDRRATC